jgi:hypothetical protein
MAADKLIAKAALESVIVGVEPPLAVDTSLTTMKIGLLVCSATIISVFSYIYWKTMMSFEAHAVDIVLAIGAVLCTTIVGSWQIVSSGQNPLSSALFVSVLTSWPDIISC